jgi:hypothetical protein
LETYEGCSDNNPYSSSSSIREFSKLYKEWIDKAGVCLSSQ